jgi:hypothetical protein
MTNDHHLRLHPLTEEYMHETVQKNARLMESYLDMLPVAGYIGKGDVCKYELVIPGNSGEDDVTFAGDRFIDIWDDYLDFLDRLVDAVAGD